MDVRQLYSQVPQTAWISSSWSWSQLGDKMPAWEPACRLRACGPQWSTVEQPQARWGRSAAMVRRTLAQYVAVCPRLQLTSHTQPASTLSRIKCERYIFYQEVCSSVHWSRHYCWLCSAYICSHILRPADKMTLSKDIAHDMLRKSRSFDQNLQPTNLVWKNGTEVDSQVKLVRTLTILLQLYSQIFINKHVLKINEY